MAETLEEKRERIAQQRAKIAEQKAKLKEREKELARREKELERPKVSPKQQTTIKVNLGAAVQAVILGRPEFEAAEKAIMDWLAATNKSNYQRGLLGLPLLLQKEKAPAKPIIAELPVYVNERIDLNIPKFPEAEREEAKRRYGARWDGEHQTWYAPPNTNLAPLKKWLPHPLDYYRNGAYYRDKNPF